MLHSRRPARSILRNTGNHVDASHDRAGLRLSRGHTLEEPSGLHMDHGHTCDFHLRPEKGRILRLLAGNTPLAQNAGSALEKRLTEMLY